MVHGRQSTDQAQLAEPQPTGCLHVGGAPLLGCVLARIPLKVIQDDLVGLTRMVHIEWYTPKENRTWPRWKEA